MNAPVPGSAFHQFARLCQQGARFVRLACVFALAMASILHVNVEKWPPSTESSVITTAQDEHRADSGSVGETCHSCSVVSFLAAAPPAGGPVMPSGVPEGRLWNPLAFAQQATAPPPRT
jgi:hypothetical protein